MERSRGGDREASVLCLEAGALTGHPVTEADLHDLVALHADPAVARTLSVDGLPATAASTRRRLQVQLLHWERHGFGVWVFREPDGRFVGRAGLKSTRVRGLEAVELLYAVRSDRWGRGYATAMARTLVSHAFDGLGLDGLVAFVVPANRASRRVLEKSDFVPDGTVEHAGLPHDLMRLERLR